MLFRANILPVNSDSAHPDSTQGLQHKSTGEDRSVTEPCPYSIFIVEDHPMMRQVLRQLLTDEPDLSVVGEAGSAEAALTALPDLTPDLLMVDLSLPGVSGIELVRELKRQRPELRCLVVTGHTDPLYRTAAAEAGAAGYVTKDDPSSVLTAVREVLKGLPEGSQ